MVYGQLYPITSPLGAPPDARIRPDPRARSLWETNTEPPSWGPSGWLRAHPVTPPRPLSEVLCLPHLTSEEHELLPSCQEAQGHLVQVGTRHNKPPRGLGQRRETEECLGHKHQARNSQPMARLCPSPSPALLACFQCFPEFFTHPWLCPKVIF